MKKLLSILIATAFAMPVMAADAEKVCKVNPDTKKETCTKKVCKVDEKTKKETCKIIKVHKKAEGTAIPDAPKKK
jgi:hypothetical protein